MLVVVAVSAVRPVRASACWRAFGSVSAKSLDPHSAIRKKHGHFRHRLPHKYGSARDPDVPLEYGPYEHKNLTPQHTKRDYIIGGYKGDYSFLPEWRGQMYKAMMKSVDPTLSFKEAIVELMKNDVKNSLPPPPDAPFEPTPGYVDPEWIDRSAIVNEQKLVAAALKEHYYTEPSADAKYNSKESVYVYERRKYNKAMTEIRKIYRDRYHAMHAIEVSEVYKQRLQMAYRRKLRMQRRAEDTKIKQEFWNAFMDEVRRKQAEEKRIKEEMKLHRDEIEAAKWKMRFEKFHSDRENWIESEDQITAAMFDDVNVDKVPAGFPSVDDPSFNLQLKHQTLRTQERNENPLL